MSEELDKSRPAFRNYEGTTFDRILRSYDDSTPIKLKQHEQEQRKRWEAAFTMLIDTEDINDREDVANKLVELFNIKRSTAYQDIANAINLFGDIHKARKEGKKYILERFAMAGLKIASKGKNAKLILEYIKFLFELNGGSEDEFAQPDWDVVLNQVNISITGNPEDIGLKPVENIAELFEKFKVKKKKQQINLDEFNG
jgi:hypothetical protein